MKVAVTGTGYVGLVTGAGLSEFGMDVTCVDVDAGKIDALNAGKIPIYEPGLDVLVERNRRERRLSFTTDLPAAVREAQVVFLAVGTPSAGDGSVDLTHLSAAAASVAGAINLKPEDSFTVVAVKSTVPVGTCRGIQDMLETKVREPRGFAVVSNPEFLREGAAVQDFMRPDRVVVGAEDPRAAEIMKKLYAPLYLIETPFVVTTLETAELIKYATNAFLAAKVSFINEVANFCDAAGADVHVVARAMGLDGRIGKKFLHPGPGFGGSCFPKDTRALVEMGRRAGTPFRIVEAALAANARQMEVAAEKVLLLLGPRPEGKTAAFLGLAFKPNTDDMRESPALKIIPALQARGVGVRAYDPAAMDNARPLLPGVAFTEDAYGACQGAHVVVLLTEWNQFRQLDLARLRAAVAAPNFADLRNVYEPSQLRAAGFSCVSVGRSRVP